MISDGIPDGYPEYLGPYYLWRLLIDTSRQGQGFGTAALDLVVAYVRTRSHAEKLLTSVVPGPASPMGFYLQYGFSQTGQVFDDEESPSFRCGSEAERQPSSPGRRPRGKSRFDTWRANGGSGLSGAASAPAAVHYTSRTLSTSTRSTTRAAMILPRT